ncbi:hypothetical protein QVD17_39100 [Tagetes erecta]|uniref:J domain-containing protein n=1 Tax=Tagetes erecta TaxID=13708 RepID=A0AAD8JMZ0_TARER|nr:hypothetical protein QVD17_39100 [Tagetes erecta]
MSRPFHSTKPSTKNPYTAIFSGHTFAGASPIDVQLYHEIFTTSHTSSIPMLNLSSLRQHSDDFTFDFRPSTPDYSNIFGGFRDQDVAVSYEELFACDKLRVPSSATTTSEDTDNVSNQSPDCLKQFNMSYNKISKKSKDGLDGTKHVTQLPAAVTGFTCFIDEPVMEAAKKNRSAVNVGVDFTQKQQLSRNAVRRQTNPVESVFEDKKSKSFDFELKKHPSTVSSSPTNGVSSKDNPKRSVNLESCKVDFDDEVDVNSAASALKKAIEKAQESIRIAKESVGRKKKGLRSFSDKKFKNRLKVEGDMEDVTASEDSSKVFPDVGRNHKHGAKVVFPSFMDSEKLIVAKKFIDEIHEKISESSKDSKFRDNAVVYKATQVSSEYATSSSEAVDTETSKTQSSEFVHEDQTNNMFIDEHEAGIKVRNDEVRLSSAHEFVEELSNLNVSLKENDEKEVFQDFNQSCDENGLDVPRELLQNETRENVIEHEDGENAESGKCEEIEEAFVSVRSENESEHDQEFDIHKDEETSDTFDGFCERDMKNSEQSYDNTLEESEVNLRNNLEESCDQEYDEKSLGDDNVLEGTDDIDCIRVASNVVEMNDINVETTQEVDDVAEASIDRTASDDDKNDINVETTQEVNDLAEASIDRTASDDINVETTQKVDDVSEVSIDRTASDETGNDINVETTQEADDVSEASIDRTASDDNEDEHEVKSEENNVIDNLEDLGSENDERSESSSGSTHDVNLTGEGSNIQQSCDEEIHGIESTNEVKDSREPESRQKQDEIEEPGPSKVSGKDRFRRTDEDAAAKEREWEKNRLAVERAIREARERAFAEARERAERERAAVEKATEEVRQRMMAEAHEKVSKASVMNKSSSEKTSALSKLRAERAAVERATSEARQRALEKAISQKSAYDLNRSESALRTKAKLEKHNRIMERAAKALAEKEKRDRLAQKEQAERNRLAENLDADIKRWSNGKERNLRALLSTLQYILGPESGWQAVSLTDIVTTNAVKKAYRKATLCVHPDKLQQRGATIQQKYICEKVFDLLKAAWNRFNSEER